MVRIATTLALIATLTSTTAFAADDVPAATTPPAPAPLPAPSRQAEPAQPAIEDSRIPGGPVPGVVQSAESQPPPPRRHGHGRLHSNDIVLKVNGEDVAYRTYQRVLREGRVSWEMLAGIFGLKALTKDGQTWQELVLIAEYAEPMMMRKAYHEQDEEHEKLAWELYRRARKGEDWTTLVKKYTTEPGAADAGGDMGLVAFPNLAHPLNRVVFTAPVGVVLPPVCTIFGWHVAKVLEVVPAHDAPAPDGSAAMRHVPEKRHVSQALILWDPGLDDTGSEKDIRLELASLPQFVHVDVLDDRLCAELPNLCAHGNKHGEPLSATGGKPN